jgi:glutaconate CoA-transferase subunit B
MSDAIAFTDTEQVIIQAARMLEPEKLHFVAIGGPPLLAALAARRLYSPRVSYVVEDGTIDPQVDFPVPPFMIGGSAASRRAAAWTSMNTVGYHAALGHIEYGVLAAIQVDQFGNFNSTMLGDDYNKPARRFGGPGGANEIASCCWRTILMTKLQKRKFVRRLDFMSSPGFLDGAPDAREQAGLPPGTGPYRVVTEDAIFGFDGATRKMKLLAVAPWTTVDGVREKMEFEPLLGESIGTIDPPTQDELTVLRSEIDPTGRTIAGQWMTYDPATRTVERAGAASEE